MNMSVDEPVNQLKRRRAVRGAPQVINDNRQAKPKKRKVTRTFEDRRLTFRHTMEFHAKDSKVLLDEQDLNAEQALMFYASSRQRDTFPSYHAEATNWLIELCEIASDYEGAKALIYSGTLGQLAKSYINDSGNKRPSLMILLSLLLRLCFRVVCMRQKFASAIGPIAKMVSDILKHRIADSPCIKKLNAEYEFPLGVVDSIVPLLYTAFTIPYVRETEPIKLYDGTRTQTEFYRCINTNNFRTEYCGYIEKTLPLVKSRWIESGRDTSAFHQELYENLGYTPSVENLLVPVCESMTSLWSNWYFIGQRLGLTRMWERHYLSQDYDSRLQLIGMNTREHDQKVPIDYLTPGMRGTIEDLAIRLDQACRGPITYGDEVTMIVELTVLNMDGYFLIIDYATPEFVRALIRYCSSSRSRDSFSSLNREVWQVITTCNEKFVSNDVLLVWIHEAMENPSMAKGSVGIIIAVIATMRIMSGELDASRKMCMSLRGILQSELIAEYEGYFETKCLAFLEEHVSASP